MTLPLLLRVIYCLFLFFLSLFVGSLLPFKKRHFTFNRIKVEKGTRERERTLFSEFVFLPSSSIRVPISPPLPSPLLASVYNHKLNTLIEMRSLWGSTRASRAGLTDGRHSSIPLPPEGGNRPCCDIGSLARGGGGGGEWGAIKGNIVVACLRACWVLFGLLRWVTGGGRHRYGGGGKGAVNISSRHTQCTFDL